MDKLYPPFAAKLKLLLENCAKRGSVYVMTAGVRTYAEQDKIYAQGRTAPGKVVSNAKGGQSIHNFGAAADFCLDKDAQKPGLQPSWDVAGYICLMEEAEKLGLECGGKWASIKDFPHIQLPLQKRGLLLHILNSVYLQDGLQGVYEKLSKYKW